MIFFLYVNNMDKWYG